MICFYLISFYTVFFFFQFNFKREIYPHSNTNTHRVFNIFIIMIIIIFMGRPKKEIAEEIFEQFQREVELAGNRTDILLHNKNGRFRSCFLSKRRKQRFDHELPTCTTCLKADFKCIQPVINQNSKFNPKNNNNYDDDNFTNTNTSNNIGLSYGKKM